MGYSLTIANQGATSHRFLLLDTLQFHVRDGDREIRGQFARDATRREGQVTAPLAPGALQRLPREALLEKQTDGRLKLSAYDGFGGVWWFDGLRPGKYRISLVYENREPTTRDGLTVWVGRGETLPMTVEIR